MKTYRIILAALLTLDGLFMTGCSSLDSHGCVYRDWSKRMSEMGIFPVYPPREDIVVGDVYALPLHPYDTAAVGYIGGLGNVGIHVEYLGDTNLGWTSLLTKLERYYQTRPYPADSTNAPVSGTTNVPLTRIPGYPDDTLRKNSFSPGSAARLRQVSFPDFNISHVDQESLSAVIPIEGIMAGLNFNRSDITGVHFSIPHAESYGLTMEELLREVYDDKHFRQTNGVLYLLGDTKDAVISVQGAQMAYAMFQDIMDKVIENPDNRIPSKVKLHMRRSVAAMKDKIYLALISEVYFARSMDITIERKTATGASGSARPIAAAELKQLKDMGLLAVHTRTNSATSTTETDVAASIGLPDDFAAGRKAGRQPHALLAAVRFPPLPPEEKKPDDKAPHSESKKQQPAKPEPEFALILFLKPALSGDEQLNALDVWEYDTERKDFPQESTVDQFFDEAQWESYRKLGEHTAEQVLARQSVWPFWFLQLKPEDLWPHATQRLMPAKP